MQSTGIPNISIKLQSSVLNEKSNDPAHPYQLSEIKDLVKLIQEPIAIFEYGDKSKAQNLMIGISQKGDEGKQFLVGLSITPTVKGVTLEINSVRNVFPKNHHDWIHWINQGRLLRVDGKAEIQAIINALRINPVDYINKNDLDSATKIVNDFQNPKLIDNKGNYHRENGNTQDDTVATEQKAQHAQALADKLQLSNVVINTEVGAQQGKKASAKGYYDPATGKIVVNAYNHSSLKDVEATILHEAVAHRGLRELFGEDFNNFLDDVFNVCAPEIQEKILELAHNKYNGDISVATEEYLASLAEDTNFEQMSKTPLWQRIKQFFRDMLRKLGLKTSISDSELRYILWRSFENLTGKANKNVLTLAHDIAKQAELKVGEFAMQEENGNLNSVNEHFNEQLNNFTEENADKIRFDLGIPSDILISAGVKKAPMLLHGNKVIKKIKKHGFELSELKDLPKAVANPIAVFNTQNNEYSRAIFTSLKTSQGNILVTIKFTKDGIVDFNIVSSVYGKEDLKIVNWINSGYSKYINKGKTLDYLHQSAPIAAMLDSQELSSATKIVENFQNPKLEEKDDVPFREDNERSNTNAINTTFNEQLNNLTEENANNLRLDLGRPNRILIKAGVEDLPMLLYGNKVLAKMKKHGFALSELKDLPQAVANPIAVFNTHNKEYSRAILTELHTQQGNVLVTLKFGKEGNIDFNIVSSVYGKNNINVIEWINKGFATYINKGKALSFLSTSAPIADATKSQELSSATKIVENFQNPKLEEKDDIRFRDNSSNDAEIALVRQSYEDRIKNGGYQVKEALQDALLSLKEYMKLIYLHQPIPAGHLRPTRKEKDFRVEDIDGFENAYLGENRLSSQNLAECETFANLLFKPLLKEISRLAPNDKDRQELMDYMFAKHGLERNEYMARRDAEKAYNEDTEKTKTLQEYIEEYRKNDYAGLTALTGNKDVQSAELTAMDMVRDYEARHKTNVLWNRVNAVTSAILSKSYEGGLMNKETYDKIQSMYNYYIPLRGFDEKTSAEEYAYLTGKNSAFNAGLKKAEGRRSKADDPIAYLQSMAESTIMQANRQLLVKQSFFNYVLNHPSDLVSVTNFGLEYDEVNEEWNPVFPTLDPNDTPEEMEQKIQEFEKKMQELAKKDPKKYRWGKDVHTIPYRVVTGSDLKQHQVLVKRNGKDYILTINGNPRLAQALNGLTNPDNDLTGAMGKLLEGIGKVNRFMSANFTTRNPNFVVSNYLRDKVYSDTMVWLKENRNYALKYMINREKCNFVKMKYLLNKHKKGELDMHDKMERAFYGFMMNGGETGYMSNRDIERHKNDIAKELKKYNKGIPQGRALELVKEQLEDLNRAVENSCRFAAFLTSRQFGRTIDRAIYDAKEISVNFNKKGAGGKMQDLTGQTRIGNIASWVSGAGRNLYVFWNAAIQGTTNFGRAIKRNPKKTIAAMATMFALGALIAALGHSGDDDEDKNNNYYNLPEYVRRANMLIRVGDNWISIPLPVEFRAIYGLGELAMSVAAGREQLSDWEVARAAAAQISQIMPLDMLEGNGGLMNLAPSTVKPAIEVFSNVDWTGMPIYKKNDTNGDMPNWTKAFKSSNKQLLWLSKVINENTMSEYGVKGDDYTKGWGDYLFNPAIVEHLLSSYLGGYATTVDQLVKTAETIIGTREFDARNIILLNRVMKSGSDRTEHRAINDAFYELKHESDVTAKRESGYEKKVRGGFLDYADRLDFLNSSDLYARHLIVKNYENIINDLQRELQYIDDPEIIKDTEAIIIELKQECINTCREISEDKKK